MSALPRLQPKKLKEVGASDLRIRFAFGALISIVAGVVAPVWNGKAGGMFLAFPAILPATLTLIEKKQSKLEAEEDDEGAMLGSVAMFAFAATATWALTALPAGLAGGRRRRVVDRGRAALPRGRGAHSGVEEQAVVLGGDASIGVGVGVALERFDVRGGAGPERFRRQVARGGAAPLVR